ncbi:PepSY domain-containing protein [Vibrio nitrifigilis]|uniref:PepSY domain-containing protein n=1 Tax=Vibrio nitrifigilis TaxID=2789781 RepID=A0ABS0GBE7_9VIBR|nr:PepSY-associated TM helix domain-containing protein [Vibrio nitrifigilis]MBF8999729.1 PepSY domain-containing protein [Vibrio nitrifigilis]
MTIQTEKFDEIQATARHFGIDANKIEIVPAYQKNQAWMVKEIDRRWPTQVDSVAINPQNLSVISHAEFEKFPLVAKLIRWGIDAHMGVLFGLINQIILALFGISLCCIIVFRLRHVVEKKTTTSRQWFYTITSSLGSTFNTNKVSDCVNNFGIKFGTSSAWNQRDFILCF